MPTSDGRVTFEGVRTTRRTRDMLLQARTIFYVRTGRKPPRISQGGFNAGGVSASAGTHDRDALDFATSGWSSHYQKEWELALWMVGFASWWRRFIYGLWPEHNHSIPKGGDLSSGAASQERAFRNKRDGLAGNRSYPRIGKWAGQTWEKYKADNKPKKKLHIDGKTVDPPASVSVGWINHGRRTGEQSRHVYLVQVWLHRLGFYKGIRDGRWNDETEEALNVFRNSLGWKGNDALGPMGINSLHWLRLKAKSTRMIREEK